MGLLYHSTGHITFSNGNTNVRRTYETDYERMQRLAWEKEEKRRKEKYAVEEREEMRGIYDFHKLPVPDYIVPEIVPELSFGSKAYYSWQGRKGARQYHWRGSCTSIGVRNAGYKIHWVNYYGICDVTKKCQTFPKNRCEACRGGNTLKGRFYADHLKNGIFQERFCWTIHIKKKKIVISEPEIINLEKIKIPESREHRFYVRPIIKGVNS